MGRILEGIRHDIQEEADLEQWISIAFDLVESRKEVPIIDLKGHDESDKLVEEITLRGKCAFVFGALPEKCEIVLSHPSISRQHAAIIIDKNIGVALIDLGSKEGSKVNDEAL